MELCPICRIDPMSHSFKQIAYSNPNIHLFYSCPAKSTKYFEMEGAIEHFQLYLDKNNHHPWAYVLDCEGFTLRHAMEIKASLIIVNMIKDTYGHALKKVWIINLVWPIKILLNVIYPILPPHLRSIVEISNKTIEQIQSTTIF
jgi:hypothetical protein